MRIILSILIITALIIIVVFENKKSERARDLMLEGIAAEACLMQGADSLYMERIDLDNLIISNTIKYIFIHCTATPNAHNLDSARLMNIFHNRGWDRSGYNFFIPTNGVIYQMRPFNWDDQITYEELAYGVAGYNSKSIHISYAGGVDKSLKPLDTRTPEQKQALNNLVRILKRKYPFAQVLGHNAVSNKACPSFDVYSEFTQ